MSYRAVVSSHMNPYLSGVAKFNHILAKRLAVECVGLVDALLLSEGPVLVSVRLSEHDIDAMRDVEALVAKLAADAIEYDLFFHTFDGLTIENDLVESCRTVFAGNEEIAHALRDYDTHVRVLWCPALIDESESVGGGEEIVVFSFGMSHKIQLEYYEMLGRLLEVSGLNYSLRISTAFHEKASFGDIDEVERHFREQFGARAHLLGFLSDAAVNHFLESAELFCAFFKGGVRANNTSVYAAMAKGCTLLTNLDEYSPKWMQHGVNVLDINSVQVDDLRCASLQELGAAAKRDVEIHASWDLLAAALSENVGKESTK